ncbi:hypothetical protein HYS79_01850 [Patescibacteria group bacterium]|nr:hypothetical protein [Patescibacteria group bacterium]
MSYKTIEVSPLHRFLLANTNMAWFWLLVRLYLGWGWLTAGWGKVQNPAWVGSDAGTMKTAAPLGRRFVECAKTI